MTFLSPGHGSSLEASAANPGEHRRTKDTTSPQSRYRSLGSHPESELDGQRLQSERPQSAHSDRHDLSQQRRYRDSVHFIPSATSPLDSPLRLRGASIDSTLALATTTSLSARKYQLSPRSPQIPHASSEPNVVFAAHGWYFPFRHSSCGKSPAQFGTSLQPFLLGLPMEARYRIYKLLLVRNETLELSTKRYRQKLRVPALLHVNRQIREEASHIWYGLNNFILTIKHGEASLARSFLAALASLRSPTIKRLDINLSTCFECNDLIAVAALLIASNIPANIICVRGVYHFGHPQMQPCTLDSTKAITDQFFRPSVATALLQSSDQQQTGAGFVIEQSSAASPEPVEPHAIARRGPPSVLGYTPVYKINPSIRLNLESAMGSVSLLLE